MRSQQAPSPLAHRLAGTSIGRAVGAVALSAALLAGLAGSATIAQAAPPKDNRGQCVVVGSIRQCIGPDGSVSQQVGPISQQVGPAGVVQTIGGGGAVQSVSTGGGTVIAQSTGGASVVQSTTAGGGTSIVQSSSGGGTSVASVSTSGGGTSITQINGTTVVAGGGFAAMPALPADVPVAIVVARGDGATYKVGEAVAVAYVVNRPMGIVRVVALQDGQATTLAQGAGAGQTGLLTLTAERPGTLTVKIIGLADDGSVHEAVVTVTIVE